MQIEKPFKKSFLFTIGYNGKPFHGNTYQTNKLSEDLPTVEKEILQALEKTLVGPGEDTCENTCPTTVQCKRYE